MKIGLVWYQITDRNVNSSIFFRFVKRMLVETGHNVAVVWDNVNYHKGLSLKDYLRRRGVLIIPIIPYVPDGNAIETWFGRVKHQFMRLKLEALVEGE